MNTYRDGFTLIELIVVIAIIAIVAVVGIHSYGNLKETQAKKMNLANIKNTYNALATYDLVREGTAGRFNNFDSLIDAKTTGAWTGTPGTFVWTDTTTTEDGLGIYDGSWKVLMALYNKVGQGSGDVVSITDAKDKNKGLRATGLLDKLGIYFLSTNDLELVKNAGIDRVLLHNPSTAQAFGAKRGGYCVAVDSTEKFTTDGYELCNGGPGFRPDMSAFYPAPLTYGSPVVIVDPRSNHGKDIYKDLGFDVGTTNTSLSDAQITALVSKNKLICFGIGKSAECVSAQVGIGEAPVNSVFDKTNYRYYLAVFALTSGGQGVSGACRLAGVLDCAGNTYKAAEYSATWLTTN